LNFKSIDLDIDNIYLKDIELQDEREYVIISLQLNMKPQAGKVNTNGWVDITPKEIKQVIAVGKKLADKWLTYKRTDIKGLKWIGNYQMIITGSEDEYWTRSEIDIHKFKIGADGVEKSLRLRDIESENNLSIFNKMIFGNKRIIGDRLENLKLSTTLYGLGNEITEDLHRLPRSFLLSLSVSSKDTKNGIQELQNKQFRLTVNTVISNFGRLLVYNARLIKLFKDEYSTINKQSQEIRENALKLQMKINDVLVSKSDSSTLTGASHRSFKIETEEGFPYHGMEEKLLLKASRYFSLLTEINQHQARVNYDRQEAVNNIEKISQTLGLTPITLLMETNDEIPSLSTEFKQLSDSINYKFQNLKLELDHSQSTIRNTVDILKTFLESEQRSVSLRSGEAINWIVIVFAGLGLADALGNFVIFWLEGGSGFEAMVWFSIIMMVLIIVVVVLYFWYFRRPKYLKI